jgi:type I restriction enzyme S subunit
MEEDFMYTIGEIVDLQRGTTYKSALLGLPGPVLLGLGTIQCDGGFRGEKLKTYGGVSPEKLILNPGSLYVSLKDVTQSGDLLGAVARVPKYVEAGRLTQDTVALKFRSDAIPPSYLYWLLRTPQYRAFCRSAGMGTTNLSLSREDFLGYEIPSMTPERENICELLEGFQDKIDLLHRQNRTLELMAETLFRQWFVVEAKEEWEEVTLGDLIDVKYGKDHKELEEGDIPVYGSGGVMRFADRALFEGESVLIPRKGTLNNVMYVNEAFWTVDTMFFTVMKRPNLAKFIYHFVKSHDLASMNVGSAVPSMTTAVLNYMPLEIPPPQVFERYENAVNPLYVKHAFNTKQIQKLTSLRDTLLPKLMSGEVRVEMGE